MKDEAHRSPVAWCWEGGIAVGAQQAQEMGLPLHQRSKVP